MRIVVAGLIAQYPLGGVTWDYLQYVVGLAKLGHDVYYIEDTGLWPYDPSTDGVSATCDFNVRYLSGVFERVGLADKWAYRFPWEAQWFGMSEQRRTRAIESCDIVLNVSGTLRDPSVFGGRLVYIDSDPVFTQVKLARGQKDFRTLVDMHHSHFSFGEALPAATPDTGHRWLPTRQPVLVDEWTSWDDPNPAYTTVMNWTSYNPLTYGGLVYGQKDVEFRKFIALPGRIPSVEFEIAIAKGQNQHAPIDLLRHRGWRVVDPAIVCPDMDSYRRYIQCSRAEWSVAKNGYVVGQAGWFSCRSACYLAAGRPVVVQDTGFGSILPTGEGLLSFHDLDESIACVQAVESDYPRHSRAADAIAREFFDYRTVLTHLLERIL